MRAVVGGDPEEVLAAIEAAGLTAANHNGSGQIVAAGTVEQLAELAANPPARARVIQLSVAGAFHTVHMEPAVAHLSGLSKAITTHDPRTRLLSNADGTVVQSGKEYLGRLVNQVANPVRWDLCLQTMADLGVTGMLELPPAGALTGIAKRNLKGVELFSLNTPDQIPAARDFVAAHADPTTTSAMSSVPAWMLVVSPSKGTFSRVAGVAAGDTLAPAAVVGQVSTLRASADVATPHGGTVVEWLVEDGDPVAPGQPLVRLHPHSEGAGGSAA
jgi:[acyl-carrier-protein] S-malonyltransferase